jgi:uncharacterized lipoprotein YddW (UPF0748 family)
MGRSRQTALPAVLVAAMATFGICSPVAAAPDAVQISSAVTQSTLDGPVVIDDFSGGVTAANHPEDAGQYRVWYDATDDAFATPSASTVDGVPAMQIDDGGYTNGVYAIYPSAIPTTGSYVVEAELHVIETGSAVDAIGAYQIGVAAGAGAAHRGPNPSDLAGLETFGRYDGLTPADDTGAGPQAVATSSFAADAGDDLLIAFGTDVRSGDWNLDSGGWAGSHAIATEIRLVPVDQPTIVIDNDDGAYIETGSWITSGSPGYDSGTYRFTSTGNAATASWTAQLPEAGSYEVEVIYAAGGNRATSATYELETANGPTTVAIDQTGPNLAWVPLGTFPLPAGPVTLVLDAAASDPPSTVVIADAVRFTPASGPPPIDEPEMRLAAITIFDDIGDVNTIQRTVDALADLHYNAIAVHTRFRGDATYIPNKTNADFPNREPRHPAAGDIDVLEEFTTRGHAAGLSVFAYMNTHLVTSGATPENRPDHVVNRHPDWITYEYNDGDPIPQEPGGEGLWLDPALPAVTHYLAGIAGDIMSNYDCDGIILDRVRYPQTSFTRETGDFGYHPVAVHLFNLLHGKHGTPDPYDPDWITFRQRAITRSVTAIHRTITEIDPQHLLLAYPIGRLDDATDFNYQDWPDWLHRNVVDGVLPQIYDQDPAAFATRLTRHRQAYEGDRLLGVTLDAFRPGNDLAGRVELVRDAGYDGTSPFRHGVMGQLGYLDDLEQAWDGVAQWPDRPGQGQPIERLDVRHDPTTPGRWIVANPNSETLHMTWTMPVTGETGSLYAPPGETGWGTSPTDHIAILIARWYDHLGRPRVDLTVSLP